VLHPPPTHQFYTLSLHDRSSDLFIGSLIVVVTNIFPDFALYPNRLITIFKADGYHMILFIYVLYNTNFAIEKLTVFTAVISNKHHLCSAFEFQHFVNRESSFRKVIFHDGFQLYRPAWQRIQLPTVDCICPMVVRGQGDIRICLMRGKSGLIITV